MSENEKIRYALADAETDLIGAHSLIANRDDTTENNYSQYSESEELTSKFAPKRLSADLLAASYSRLGLEKKYERVSSCGTSLLFAHEINTDTGEFSEKGKLHLANFCRDRLCPMCNWRRSMKIFSQVSEIMDLIEKDYEFLFLTLTVPNCSSLSLSDWIDKLIKSFNRLIKRKKIDNILCGYFRALEITYNERSKYFHPHLHIILAVKKSYFQSYYYIRHDEWLHMWNNAVYGKDKLEKEIARLGRYPITQVNIQKCKSKYSNLSQAGNHKPINLQSAVAEAAKYAVKSEQYLRENDPKLSDKLVSIFSDCLYHRRLVQFGGIFLDTFHKLGLDDLQDENSDLTHINDSVNGALAQLICCYGWRCGVYTLSRSYIEYPKNGGDCDE